MSMSMASYNFIEILKKQLNFEIQMKELKKDLDILAVDLFSSFNAKEGQNCCCR